MLRDWIPDYMVNQEKAGDWAQAHSEVLNLLHLPKCLGARRQVPRSSKIKGNRSI